MPQSIIFFMNRVVNSTLVMFSVGLVGLKGRTLSKVTF